MRVLLLTCPCTRRHIDLLAIINSCTSMATILDHRIHALGQYPLEGLNPDVVVYLPCAVPDNVIPYRLRHLRDQGAVVTLTGNCGSVSPADQQSWASQIRHQVVTAKYYMERGRTQAMHEKPDNQ